MPDTFWGCFKAYSLLSKSAKTPREREQAEVSFEIMVSRLRLRELEREFTRAPKSNSMALFEAIEIAGRLGIPVEAWASDAFSKGVWAVRRAACRSWDDAFGKARPLKTSLVKERERQLNDERIFQRVEELREGGTFEIPEGKVMAEVGPPRTVDDALFEQVAREFRDDGVCRRSASYCRKAYYRMKHRHGPLGRHGQLKEAVLHARKRVKP